MTQRGNDCQTSKRSPVLRLTQISPRSGRSLSVTAENLSRASGADGASR
jgi:hypothetical protein